VRRVPRRRLTEVATLSPSRAVDVPSGHRPVLSFSSYARTAFRSLPLLASSLTCQRQQSRVFAGRLHPGGDLNRLVPTSAQPRPEAYLRHSMRGCWRPASHAAGMDGPTRGHQDDDGLHALRARRKRSRARQRSLRCSYCGADGSPTSREGNQPTVTLMFRSRTVSNVSGDIR